MDFNQIASFDVIQGVRVIITHINNAVRWFVGGCVILQRGAAVFGGVVFDNGPAVGPRAAVGAIRQVGADCGQRGVVDLSCDRFHYCRTVLGGLGLLRRSCAGDA